MSVSKDSRFSQIYLPRGEPTNDSDRMRRRLYRIFEDSPLSTFTTRPKVEGKLGIIVPYFSGSGRPRWSEFFATCELRDLLDMVSIVAQVGLVENTAYQHAATRWIGDVQKIFREENVGYKVDANGTVHFAIDTEFGHSVACTLAALDGTRYVAVRSHFDAGQKALDGIPPQTREAIRQTFESCETLFKLMFPKESVLGSSEATKKLKPLIEARFSGTERNVAIRLLEGFKGWVNSAHPYRHGQGVEMPDNPSVQTAVLSLSLGAAYIRWLAEIDQVVLKGNVETNQTATAV